ncbi:MAG: PH domain-containing protein [Leucobacter sp.]|nr:PH domain-containing protein [Leucobacter sp.]
MTGDTQHPGHDGATPLDLELPWRRLHPLSPLLRGGLFLIVLIGGIIANLRDRVLELFVAEEYVEALGPNEGDLIDFLVAQGLVIWLLLAVLAVILLIVGISWMSWRFASFRITSEAVESRWGIVFKQHRRAPLERIQSVNLQRSLLARLLGLTQVEIQTAGQGGKVALQYLGHRDAKQVREQILLAAGARSRRTGASGAQTLLSGEGARIASPEGAQHDPSSLQVDPAGRTYATAKGALDDRLRDLADFDIDPSARDAGALIKVPTSRLIASILLSSEMLILVLIVLALVGSSIWASPFILAGLFPVMLVFLGVLIGQFNKGFNFVLSRAADGVRVGAGLTSTTTETVPFGRVHAVEAMQPLGWRPFGWWKMRITTAGHSAAQAGQNKLQNTVLPVGDVNDVVRVFETLLHGDEEGSAEREALILDGLIGSATGYLKAGKRSGLLLLGKKRAGLRIEYAQGEQASLRIRRGWFTKTLCVMPILRAQSIQLSRPLWHRLFGLAVVQAHTVLGPVRMQMRGLALDDARQAFDVLADTVVAVQGAEAQRVAERAKGQP